MFWRTCEAHACHRRGNCSYTSLQELAGFFNPGVLSPGLEEVGEGREIICNLCVWMIFFFFRGEGC